MPNMGPNPPLVSGEALTRGVQDDTQGPASRQKAVVPTQASQATPATRISVVFLHGSIGASISASLAATWAPRPNLLRLGVQALPKGLA